MRRVGKPRGLPQAVSKWLVDIRHNTSECKGGQVTEYEGRGLSIMLYRLALLVRAALEVGTFYGCGSTLLIAKGLIDGQNGGRLWTVESSQHLSEAARNVMTRHALPVDVLHGMASPAHMILPRDDLQAYLPHDASSRPGSYTPSEYRNWHANEQWAAARLTAANQTAVIERLCRREGRPIELVFLDGAEMYGTADVHQALRHCAHVRFIAMDDIGMFKHHTSVRELKTPGWGFSLCFESPPNDDRPGGWAVFAADEDAAGCLDLAHGVRRYMKLIAAARNHSTLNHSAQVRYTSLYRPNRTLSQAQRGRAKLPRENAFAKENAQWRAVQDKVRSVKVGRGHVPMPASQRRNRSSRTLVFHNKAPATPQ